MQIFLFIALLIAALAAVFALQNSTPVQVSFLTLDFDSSLAIVLLVALAAGALMSFFVSLPGNVRARLLIRQQRKKITELETGLVDAKARLETATASLTETAAKLEDASARAEMLEAKLTMLPVAGSPAENPAPAELPAPKESQPKEPGPTKPKIFSIFPRSNGEEE